MAEKEKKSGRGSYVFFEKEEYTLPEIINLVARQYDITIGTTNRKTKRMIKNSNYFTIYQKIKRKLDEIIDEEETGIAQQNLGGRQTKYPTELVNRVVNDDLGIYFTKFASEERAKVLKKYGERADELSEEFENNSYYAFQAELDDYWKEEMQRPEYESERIVYGMLQNFKFDILMDIIFKHLIFLDEDKLKFDLTFSLTFEDNPPDSKGLEIMDHLADKRNYYKWRTEKLAELFDN